MVFLFMFQSVFVFLTLNHTSSKPPILFPRTQKETIVLPGLLLDLITGEFGLEPYGGAKPVDAGPGLSPGAVDGLVLFLKAESGNMSCPGFPPILCAFTGPLCLCQLAIPPPRDAPGPFNCTGVFLNEPSRPPNWFDDPIPTLRAVFFIHSGFIHSRKDPLRTPQKGTDGGPWRECFQKCIKFECIKITALKRRYFAR